MKWARELTDAELRNELGSMFNRERELCEALDESGGASGSPMEWLYERWDELEAEAVKRRLPSPQAPPHRPRDGGEKR